MNEGGGGGASPSQIVGEKRRGIAPDGRAGGERLKERLAETTKGSEKPADRVSLETRKKIGGSIKTALEEVTG